MAHLSEAVPTGVQDVPLVFLGRTQQIEERLLTVLQRVNEIAVAVHHQHWRLYARSEIE